MRKIIVALMLCLTAGVSIAAGPGPAPTSEYAKLQVNSRSLVLTDKNGTRVIDTKLFVDLSGIDQKDESGNHDQREIQLLNGLSKLGWHIVHVRDADESTVYLLERDGDGKMVAASTQPAGDHVPVTFSGGHDTDPVDHGRPVVLIAAGLGVTTDVFRDAFTHVKPAGPDRGPTDDEARANKEALLSRLSKYGVTDDKLNTVSNYYRYMGQHGEIWKNAPASAYAIVKDGKILQIVVTDPGAGYSTPPTVTVAGMKEALEVKLSFGTDLKTNGSIASVTVNP